MKAREWERASEPLRPFLVGFERMKWGFVKQTGEWTVACLTADPSGFSRTTFYLTACALPLYVPTTYLYYSCGFRIGQSWEGVDSRLVDEVHKAVPKLLKLADLCVIVKQSSRWKADIHHLEVRLGAGVILDDRRLVSEARQVLPNWEIQQAWEQEVLDRCTQLLHRLDAEGKDGAVVELTRRREVTAAMLK